jgi:hypothetical protein
MADTGGAGLNGGGEKIRPGRISQADRDEHERTAGPA